MIDLEGDHNPIPDPVSPTSSHEITYSTFIQKNIYLLPILENWRKEKAYACLNY